MTDAEILAENAHIPDSEILQDIADTGVEIMQMEAEAEHLSGTPLSMPSAKWDHMRASGRMSGIAKRIEFIDKLEKLLALRKANGGSPELTGPNQGGESCPPPPRICKACECPIDEDGCGCNPHDA